MRSRESLITVPDLEQHLGDLLRQVPAGRVTTYGRLAEALGNVAAARWVATALLDPDFALGLPTHRVLLRDGRVGGYCSGKSADKVRALLSDGVELIGSDQPLPKGEGIGQSIAAADLERYGFCDFASSRPLEQLRQLQERMRTRIRLRAPGRIPDLIAGVDVSYITPTDAVVGYALVEVEAGELVWSATLRRKVRFPYIPTYLSFRELPLLLDVLAHAEDQHRLAEVILVDGAGILHQRHAGIASHLGVVTGLSTIGVTKKKLCGQVDLAGLAAGEARPVIHEGETVALAVRTRPRGHPIFISPGHRADLPYALQVIRLLMRNHKLPEPVHWAHTLSKRAASQMKIAASAPP